MSEPVRALKWVLNKDRLSWSSKNFSVLDEADAELTALLSLAREAGEALVKIGRPVGNEQMWLKRDILDKLRAAGILKGGE